MQSFSIHFACVSFLAVLLLGGCSHVASSDNQPKLVVLGANVHDFGKCSQGDVLNHTFKLRNSSSFPISIVHIRTSCGCIAAGNDNDFVFKPNQQLDFPIRLEVGELEAVTGRIVLYYAKEGVGEDGPLSSLTLLLRGDVIPDYRLNPKSLDFGRVDGISSSGEATMSVTLTPESLPSACVVDVATSHDWLGASASQRDDGTTNITVTLDPSHLSLSQKLFGHVVLSTTSARVPKALVSVKADYVAPVVIQPTAITIQSTETGIVEKSIDIKTALPTRLTQLTIEPADTEIACDSDQQLISLEHQVRLKVPEGERPGNVQIAVEFQGDEHKVVAVRVPVFRFWKGIQP